jgi:TonB family protein
MTSDEVSLLSVFTFVLWTSCLFVGVFGLLAEGLPRAGAASEPALSMEVDLVSPAANGESQSAIAQAGRETAAPLPTPMVQMPEPGEHPPLLATRVRGAPAASSDLNDVRQLSDGDVAGFLPVPDYPIDAKLAHQEGTVIIIFTVGTDGRVTDARIASACPWPLLNESALRTVRDDYRLAPGPVRRRWRSFTFQINE